MGSNVYSDSSKFFSEIVADKADLISFQSDPVGFLDLRTSFSPEEKKNILEAHAAMIKVSHEDGISFDGALKKKQEDVIACSGGGGAMSNYAVPK